MKRLRSLFSNERGNVLLIGAATLPMVFGAAGFGVDSIHLALMKRQVQRAADSAAMAGAYALTQSEDAPTAVTNDMRKHTAPGGTAAVSVGTHMGHQNAVRVVVTASKPLPFMKIFTRTDTTITAQATAAVIKTGRFCVLSLYKGTDPGIDASGNSKLDLGCGLATNAQGDQAIRATGSSTVIAPTIMAVGGIDGTSNNFEPPAVLKPYSAAQTDPFASYPDPAPLTGCRVLDIGPQGPHQNDPAITPGSECYSSIDIKGPVTLPAGTYYVNGDISFGAKAAITGTGVTFVMTGPGGAAGDLTINGDATMNLTASTTGPYAGMLFFRDRRADDITITINGSATTTMSGIFYFPKSNVTFNGNSGMDVNCFQLVGQKLNFSGGATLKNKCSTPGFGQHGFETQMVRLVG